MTSSVPRAINGPPLGIATNHSEAWLADVPQVADGPEPHLSAHKVNEATMGGARPNSKKGSAKENRDKAGRFPDDLYSPVALTDPTGYILPTGPNMASGPLPLPGSLTSGPLLPATHSSSNNTELFSQTTDSDNENLATQLLYFDPALESDADRPTDINLGQYIAEISQASRHARSASTSTGTKPTSGRSSGSGTSSRSTQSKAGGDDPISKMKQLKMLLDAGFITEADYEAKKADILARFF